MDALIELQGKEAIYKIAPLLKDEVVEVSHATHERLSQLQNLLLTALINKSVKLLMVLCPLLAVLPLFLRGMKFFAGIAVFAGSLYLFDQVANMSFDAPYLREGSLLGEAYRIGVLIVFAVSMFLKLSWWVIVNLFKFSSDIDEKNIKAKTN